MINCNSRYFIPYIFSAIESCYVFDFIADIFCVATINLEFESNKRRYADFTAVLPYDAAPLHGGAERVPPVAR